MRLSHSGKVKDIYEVDSKNLLFHFTDRVSAFDVPMITPIVGKGEILCKFAEFWFKILNVKNHMIRKEGPDKILVRKLTMIPIECIVRGYLYGSLFERFKRGDLNLEILDDNPRIASKLSRPLFDPTTKTNIHDRPISEWEIFNERILDSDELKQIKDISMSMYERMSKLADRVGFIIADVKFEFGRDPASGEIILADSIGPDEFRIWSKSLYVPGKIQESYDKQYLRDWLTKIGFKRKVEESDEGTKPVPPPLPQEVAHELMKRYSYVYERICSSQGFTLS